MLSPPFQPRAAYRELRAKIRRLADESLLRRYIDRAHYERAYAERTGEALARSSNLGRHYLDIGAGLGLSPNADFQSLDYVDANPDVRSSGMDPFLHYCRHGRREGRSPIARPAPELQARDTSWDTDPQALSEVRDGVEAEHAAVATAAATAAVLEPHFDRGYYLAQNPDVRDERVDPLSHYVSFGWREGRDPSANFSTSGYLDLYPDVSSAGINPLLHFVTQGSTEGRRSRPDDGPHRAAISVQAWPPPVAFTQEGDGDDVQQLRDVLEAALAQVREADLYLTVSHDDYTRNVGGIQACLAREGRALAGRNCLHLHLFPGEHSTSIRDDADPLLGVLVNGDSAGRHPTSAVIAELGRSLRGGAMRVGGFCIHSLLGHSVPAVASLLTACGARTVFFWLHDYLSVCSGYNLTRNDIQFCSAPPAGSGACLVCIHSEKRAAAVAGHEHLFARFDVTVVAPSSTALAVWSRASNLRAALTLVHPHARFSAPLEAMAADGMRFEPGGPLRVAFVGSPRPQKGWFVFQKLIERFGHDPRYMFHQLSTEPVSPPPLQFERVHPSDGGAEAMQHAIERLGIDVALVWSLWPETFCLSAYEAIAGGAALLTWRGAGHVATVCEEMNAGLVLEGYQALVSAFQTGTVTAMARARRPRAPLELRYSRVTVDLLPELAR